MDNYPKVCRLCLEVINNPNFDEALDAVKLSMLKILPLNISPAYTIDASVCSHCSDKLQHIFHFKMACLDNNDYIKTFLHCDSGFMVVLEETIVRSLSQDVIKHEEEKVCRFCLKYFDIALLTKLNGLEEDIFLKDMLEKCLPELNLNITKDPSVCQDCMDMLQNQFNFVINCLDVDERVQNFISSGTNNNDDRLDLSVVLKFDKKQLKRENDDDIKDIPEFVVKKEDVFEDPEESNFQCKLEGNLESNLEHEETIPEECIKLEENIKSDSDSEESLPNSPCQPDQPFSFPEAEMLEKNADGMFVCTVCPHQTNRRPSLIKHFLIHKKKAEREFKCEECQFVTNYKASLRLHAQLHKDPVELEMFYCAQCSYKSMHKKHVRRHCKRHMKSDSTVVQMYQCQFCSVTTKNKDYFKLHNKTKHNKNIVLDDELRSCEKCGYKSKNPRNLINHMRIIHNILKEEIQPDKKYACEFCDYRTHKMYALRDHLLKHRSCDDIEMLQCPHCSFRTKYRSSLRSHIKRHESGWMPQKGKRTAKSGTSE